MVRLLSLGSRLAFEVVCTVPPRPVHICGAHLCGGGMYVKALGGSCVRCAWIGAQGGCHGCGEQHGKGKRKKRKEKKEKKESTLHILK